MAKLKEKFKLFKFKGVLVVVFFFAVIALILFIELSGVRYNYTQKKIKLLSVTDVVTNNEAYNIQKKDVVVFYSEKDESSYFACEQFEVILKDMKQGAEFVNLDVAEFPELNKFNTAIVLLSDLKYLGKNLITLCDWVRDDGGNVMFSLTLESNAYFFAIENKIGIESCGNFTEVDNIYVNDGFMVGGGKSFVVTDAYDSARTVVLNKDKTRVYAAEEHKDGVPLIWEADYGKGEFVVCNFGICDKGYRGFYAASLSLFDDVFVYPVINGSTFYLDDFPSQIPSGSNEYISRDFNTTVRDFYINIWWPDMMNLTDKYGIKYTGLVIESYDDSVDGTTDSGSDEGTFLNFGNMLLRKGGELGYHGYNHQPLCFDNCDYRGVYDYKTWDDRKAMVKAFTHLTDFCEKLFPDVEFNCYIPPSNLLSKEGRQVLQEEFEQIKTFSGIYFPDDKLDFSLVQEYEVFEDGTVDQPRLISGCDINEFMSLAAFSELNMHYVNNHFTHPDDALDPERGAELGWAELYRRFNYYLDWLYSSAKGLRNFTSTEFSAAVQRYAAVTYDTKINEDSVEISIGNFVDDAQFLVRFNNKKTPKTVQNARLTHLTGDLYLLEANKQHVMVFF